MAKTRGFVRVFGNGLWRVRKLGKATSLGIRMRHKGAVHAAVTDVVLEKQKSRSSDWKTASMTIQNGDERDDLKVYCDVLREK